MQLGKKKIISHKKKMFSILRCVITSFLIAITLIKVRYVLYIHMCKKKKKCKLVKQNIY